MVVCIDVPRVERRNKVRVNSPPTSVLLLLLLLQLQLQLLLTPLNTGTLFALRGQHALIFFYRNTHSIYYIYNYVPQTFVPPVGARPPHLYGREELCQPDTREPYARGLQPEDKASAEGPSSSQCGRKPESRLHQRRGGDAVMRTVTGTYSIPA